MAAALFLAGAGIALAEVRYVDATSTNATPPYTNWVTAATNIQDAVDAAVAGDDIVVTNGFYNTGIRGVGGVLGTNRVAIDKPLSVRSVNGSEFTTINGGGQFRCVYLGSNAVLTGFTLTNGYAPHGGGAQGGTLNNCTLSGNSVYQVGSSCSGGGAALCTLNNCTLSSNSATGGAAYGGGAAFCTLNNCTLSGNSASSSVFNGLGGGVYKCALDNCTLNYNTANLGGGACYSTLNNCTLTGNNSFDYGGGAFSYGGGTYGGTLNNCTLTGNSAGPGSGGGAYGATLNNCIVYFNTAMNGANFDLGQSVGVLNYCCTTPQPTNGVGNITNAALFVDTNDWANLRLQSNSPCINAGNNAFAPAGPDLDGNPRIVGGTVDIGAYEYQSLSLLNFSVVSNQAGFNITGQSDQVVIVERSSDLVNWSPLATNTLSGHPFPFSDPTPATLPRRFYRAQAP